MTIAEIWDILLVALPCHGRRFPLFGGELLAPPDESKGVVAMITWTELFAFCMFVVALIALVKQDR